MNVSVSGRNKIADEKRWEMYANDLADQMNAIQQVLTELHDAIR
jgi:hypothetical protein